MEDPKQQEVPQKVLPFDNLYLNSGYVSGFNVWWMYLFTILITITCYVCAPAITSIYLLIKATQNGVTLSDLSENANLLFDYKFIGVDKNTILIALLGIFVITALGFLISIKHIHKKTITSILTSYEKFRFTRFWFGFAIWGSFLIIMVLANYLLDPESLKIDFQWQGFLISMLLMLVFMPIQTGFEEAFFRGYLVQGLSQIIKNGIVPVVITSLLFGAAHMSNPEVQKYGWPIMLTYYVFFALFMGCLTLLDEGLELAFGIHFANNFISSILINSPNSVLKTYSIFESKTENPYQEIVLWFCMAIATFFVFWWKYKWKNFKLIIR
jgi:uncharacterized protein